MTHFVSTTKISFLDCTMNGPRELLEACEVIVEPFRYFMLFERGECIKRLYKIHS